MPSICASAMRHSWPPFSTTGSQGLLHFTVTDQPEGTSAHPVPMRVAVESVMASDGLAHQKLTTTPVANCSPRLVTRANTRLASPITGRLMPRELSTHTSGDSQKTAPL